MSTKLRGISALVRRGQWQTALVALICASLLMSIASLYSLHRFANNANEQVARLLAFAGEPAAVFKDEDAMRDVVLQIASREQLAEVNVLDRDGKLWIRHVKEASGLLDSMARATDRLFLPEPARAALESNGMRIGEVVLRSDGHFLMRYFGLVLLALGACVVITAVAVVAVSRRLSTAIVDPVRDLATLTREVRTSRSFQLRAGNTSVIEFNELADDFNNLLSELQAQQVKIAARHTDLQNANDSLRHTSRHDGLTQLPNRAYLVEHLNAVISRCLQDDTRAAALFVDVDKFKAVNDLHGHEAGDELLRELARRLLASVRASDFVARLGGDEFIVVISPLSDAHEVSRCVERIRGAIAPGLTLPNCTQLRMSVTIGSAICPVDAQDLDGLIRAADAAMYEAKTRARGSFAAYERPRAPPT